MLMAILTEEIEADARSLLQDCFVPACLVQQPARQKTLTVTPILKNASQQHRPN